MQKVLLIIFVLALALSVSAKESIRGHFEIVGQVPTVHSVKKVVFEEFMNFGCPHCNSLHKASIDFRKKFADKVDFIDIPLAFRGQNDSPLRLYYVARKIGKGKLIKDELFKTSFTHGVNVFDSGITNYLARSLGMNKEFQMEKDQAWVNELIEEGEEKRIDPLIGRENEINRTMQILCRRRKNNPIYVGDPGVGKTAVAEGLALQIFNGNSVVFCRIQSSAFSLGRACNISRRNEDS